MSLTAIAPSSNITHATCTDLTPDHDFLGFDSPQVLGGHGNEMLSVLIPGRGSAVTMINTALDTLHEYGLPIDTSDPAVDAEVHTSEFVRLHRCSDPRHEFHPEFAVDARTPGAALVSRVTFSVRR